MYPSEDPLRRIARSAVSFFAGAIGGGGVAWIIKNRPVETISAEASPLAGAEKLPDEPAGVIPADGTTAEDLLPVHDHRSESVECKDQHGDTVPERQSTLSTGRSWLVFLVGASLFAVIAVLLFPSSLPQPKPAIIEVWSEDPSVTLCAVLDMTTSDDKVVLYIGGDLPSGRRTRVLVQQPSVLGGFFPTTSSTAAGRNFASATLTGPSECSEIKAPPATEVLKTAVAAVVRSPGKATFTFDARHQGVIQRAGSHTVLSAPRMFWGTADASTERAVRQIINDLGGPDPFLPQDHSTAWAKPKGQIIAIPPPFMLDQRTDVLTRIPE